MFTVCISNARRNNGVLLAHRKQKLAVFLRIYCGTGGVFDNDFTARNCGLRVNVNWRKLNRLQAGRVVKLKRDAGVFLRNAKGAAFSVKARGLHLIQVAAGSQLVVGDVTA